MKSLEILGGTKFKNDRQYNIQKKKDNRQTMVENTLHRKNMSSKDITNVLSIRKKQQEFIF